MQISFIAAFLGGMISLFSPCSAMVLPTFAAASANKKSSLFHTSLIFLAGLITSLVPLAFGVIAISRLLLLYREVVSSIIGIIFIILGIAVLLKKHVPIPDIGARLQNNIHTKTKTGGVFLLGLVSGLGSSACVGPILGAILSLAAISHSPVTSIMLMITYAVGIMFPLIILAQAYDRYGQRISVATKKSSFRLGNVKVSVIDIVSGGLLLVVGYIFLSHQGSLGFLAIFRNTGILDAVFTYQEKVLFL